MLRLLCALVLVLPLPAAASECAAPSDCGIGETLVPDFTLTDVNTNSPTHGQVRSRDDFLGEVLVIYWSKAT